MAEYGAHESSPPATDPRLVVVVPPPRHRLHRVIIGAAPTTTVVACLCQPVCGGMEEGGGVPLHHPLRVEHCRGGGGDGIGVVPASASESAFVDVNGATPHAQQAVIHHQREVVALLIGDDGVPLPSDHRRRRSRWQGRC